LWGLPQILAKRIPTAGVYESLLRLWAPAPQRLGKHSWGRKQTRRVKSARITASWILQRHDLKHLSGGAVRKIAAHWIDFVDWWFLTISQSLDGINRPSYQQVKSFTKYRHNLHRSKGIQLDSLVAILGGVMSAIVRLGTVDGSLLPSSRGGFFAKFPGLRNFILGLYSDQQLDVQGFCRFRCGLQEISELKDLFAQKAALLSYTDRLEGSWVLDYLDLAHDGAVRGSELLKSYALCDKRTIVALWRRDHIPAVWSDCQVYGSKITIFFRHMKNKLYYKKNHVTLVDPLIIQRLLDRHNCNNLQDFATGARLPSAKRSPLLYSPYDSSKFVTIDAARGWLKTFLRNVAPPLSDLQRINIHSPRAGLAAPYPRTTSVVLIHCLSFFRSTDMHRMNVPSEVMQCSYFYYTPLL
jgi:hypothetical protein